MNSVESHRPLLARARDTFLAPTRLFSAFGDNAPWVGALALATAMAAAAIVAEPAEFFLSQLEDPVNRRGAPVEITSSPAQIVLYGRMMAVLSALAGHPIIAFVVAGLLSLLFTVIGHGQISYRQYLALASHALLISAVGMLVTVLLRLASGDAAALPTVAALLPGVSDETWLGRVLGGVNLFTLWMLTVLGIGIATLEARFTRTRVTALLWAGYAVLVVTTSLLFRV